MAVFEVVTAQELMLGSFDVNVSPTIGSPVAYAPTRSITEPLHAKGVVIKSAGDPIVLCSVDFLGIANEGLDAWREALAEAAGTTIDRVSVNAVHQHDGMRCDFTVERILQQEGLGGIRYDIPQLKKQISRVAKKVKRAAKRAKPFTHIGYGEAEIKKVASNRRIIGSGDTVEIIRWSKSQDSLAINAPEGLIDPLLRSVSFWNQDKALAIMTYYACHPQSYYGQGDVTCEFIGIAREAREKKTKGIRHIHFNGAGGNIAAGKYNDGSKEMRPVLANRVEEGMRKAWENTEKVPISETDLSWKVSSVSLPLASHLIEESLQANLKDNSLEFTERFTAAKHLAWLRETNKGRKVDVSSLTLGKVILLHLPGEIFIEYQLAAQNLRPDAHVCVAAYGEYGPGYIGTKKAYPEGGYETSKKASRVSPEVEEVLMRAIEKVLKK